MKLEKRLTYAKISQLLTRAKSVRLSFPLENGPKNAIPCVESNIVPSKSDKMASNVRSWAGAEKDPEECGIVRVNKRKSRRKGPSR